MDIKFFVNITSKAWSVPILAQMHAGVPGRQAPLLTATGAGRTAFAQSMEHLITIGLVERNPGYGHPLRPEFRLTDLGRPAAQLAHQIHHTSKGEDQTLLRRAWTLPILASLRTPRHFAEIKHELPPITDRALSQSLKTMEATSWVHRRVDRVTRPPRAQYTAVNIGGLISQITNESVTFIN